MIGSTTKRAVALTPRGLAVAYTYRLRQAAEMLPATDMTALLVALRELVSVYATCRPNPAA